MWKIFVREEGETGFTFVLLSLACLQEKVMSLSNKWLEIQVFKKGKGGEMVPKRWVSLYVCIVQFEVLILPSEVIVHFQREHHQFLAIEMSATISKETLPQRWIWSLKRSLFFLSNMNSLPFPSIRQAQLLGDTLLSSLEGKLYSEKHDISFPRLAHKMLG